jgi:hypothetical protein
MILPHHNDLAVGVGAGLEQDRVHARLWHNPGSQGLQVLGAANFQSVGCDGGVVTHILRFERRDAQATIGVVAAQRGH